MKIASVLQNLAKDLPASLVVFLVALPLCLGVAVASGAPPISGLIAGIVGGILVGALSGSHTSVSGPAAGLTAVVATQIASLGSFESFLAAVVVGGVLQMVLGIVRGGFVAGFFPLSVVKGLLAAIGVILILKQIPHLIGYDSDPMGDKSFAHAGGGNTFSDLLAAFGNIEPGAMMVGLASLLLLVLWDRSRRLKSLVLPAPLVVVFLGVAVNEALQVWAPGWTIFPSHLVAVPASSGFGDFVRSSLTFPQLAAFARPEVYMAGVTIALVASLETLLNLKAVDKLDPRQRLSPPNRELFVQGAGNFVSGLLGGLPVTSVIVRSSVNINAGARTKISAIVHGVLLLACVVVIPGLLNKIPLAALAAILMSTGFKLASPQIVRQMWREGWAQFAPFAITVTAIVFTDLLVGILIGLAAALAFILRANASRGVTKFVARHPGGEVTHIVLSNQVSFLGRAALERALRDVPTGGHLLLDAESSQFIDPDVLDIITDFRDTTAQALGIQLSLKGFNGKHPDLKDEIHFVDHSSRDLQSKLEPEEVLEIFKVGHQRFLSGRRLTRDVGRQIGATAEGQFPLAVVLSCIDSRVPAEMIFDLGIGDVFNVRIAGNVARDKVLGSMEYACAVAGAKLVLVMGHTSCGAVNAAVDLLGSGQSAREATGCDNLDSLITELQLSVDVGSISNVRRWNARERALFANEVSKRNVIRTMRMVSERSATLQRLVDAGKVAVVGCIYNVHTGEVEFIQTPHTATRPLPRELAQLSI
jgi:MFS superfamily sulfate permease-like transporter